MTDVPRTASWRKSTYSSNGDGACLEVADGIPGLLPVRDSKNPSGPVLVFSSPAWRAFLSRAMRN
ncbi:DUF397 domain-containing protein [Streptomyces sp. YIM 98790]|uniref:DUF397 domain-containing protein n=1 Tax=Streptomyces sp. YIM 98790 TaxID=2689077 RepID=UPI00140877B6|nr:DUF397 domain-containing protein [Streptomyces sp. YIM 98790]